MGYWQVFPVFCYTQSILSLERKFPQTFADFFAATIFPGICKQLNTTVSTVAPFVHKKYKQSQSSERHYSPKYFELF